MADDIRVVDLKPTKYGPRREPYYTFHTSFPPKNVRALPEAFETKEAAYNHARTFVRTYESRTFPGGMGEVLGVTPCSTDPSKWCGVINTYYSST